MTPLLRVEGLSVSFDARGGRTREPAVLGVTLELERGKTLAVVGESGSGKSVTALSILRLLPPSANIDAGRVLISDSGAPVDLLRLSEREMRRIRGGRIAMIFQEPMTSLNPVMTVGEQIVEAVRLHRALRGRAAKRAAIEAMEEVGIASAAERLAAYPHEFSGGMRQRVMIAMALACRPAALIADEPTTALDTTTQAQVLQIIDRAREERGMGVMLITHSLGLAASRAERVCVMRAGQIVEEGPTERVFACPEQPYTRQLLASIPPLRGERRRRLTAGEVR